MNTTLELEELREDIFACRPLRKSTIIHLSNFIFNWLVLGDKDEVYMMEVISVFGEEHTHRGILWLGLERKKGTSPLDTMGDIYYSFTSFRPVALFYANYYDSSNLECEYGKLSLNSELDGHIFELEQQETFDFCSFSKFLLEEVYTVKALPIMGNEAYIKVRNALESALWRCEKVVHKEQLKSAILMPVENYFDYLHESIKGHQKL